MRSNTIIKAFSAFIFPLLISPAIAGNDEVSELIRAGSWSSFQLCNIEGCSGRASVVAKNRPSDYLTIDFYNNEIEPRITLFSPGVSDSSIRTWHSDNTDTIPVKLRVDYNAMISTTAERHLNRGDKVILWHFINLDNKDFAEQLKRGSTLRIRAEFSKANLDYSFLLNGAANSINRARKIADELPPETNPNYYSHSDNPENKDNPK